MTVTPLAADRERALRELASPFDLIVIGGGCNGVGIAWDAALRGLRVVLVEKEDFGWATSAWNSRMIHGGLKYLEKYDVPLVRESLREREWLLRAAPHLVRPLRFLLPFYDRNQHSSFVLRLGMVAYDLLSWDKSTPRHCLLDRDEVLRTVPGIDPDGLRGGAAYFDAQVEYAERLSVEAAVAARAAGAVVLNHARAERLLCEGRRVVGVEVVDTETGRRHEVRGRITVNAAGPWVDEVLASVGLGEQPRLIGGTKGTHLVVDPFPGAPQRDAMYYEAVTDARPMMVIPWLGRYLLGSTDERFVGDLDTASADEEEIAYILKETNRVLPKAGLTAEHILWSYTGVRPLPYQSDGPTSDITRRHTVHDHEPALEGLLSVVGGKLTTFRSLAEDVNDHVLKRIGAKRRSLTRRLRLPGGNTLDFGQFRQRYLASTHLPHEVAERLLRIYGVRSPAVEALVAEDPRLGEVIDEATHAIAAEVVFAARHEFAVTLTDLVARRLMTGVSADLGTASLERVAAVAERHLGWSSTRASEELDAYLGYVKKFSPRTAIVR